ASVFAAVLSLECHTGYSVIKGSRIGEEIKQCGKDTDYCYNATAPIFTFGNLQKAGCNTFVCQFFEEGCHEREVLGVLVKFCCCRNEDLCNRGKMTGTVPLLDRGTAVIKEVVDFFD
ncbi:hypothetical protein OESDEN_14631, partial [Oesophagostomum dentatum]